MSNKTSWGVLLFALFFGLSAYAQDKVTLQLKWHHQFQFAGYYAAKALGYYADEGLDVGIKPVALNTNPAEVIAEGVETAAQAAALDDLGCDYRQWYFFSRPLLPESFEHLLCTGISVTWAAARHAGLTHPHSNPNALREVDVKT